MTPSIRAYRLNTQTGTQPQVPSLAYWTTRSRQPAARICCENACAPADSPSQSKAAQSMRYEYVRSRGKAQTC